MELLEVILAQGGVGSGQLAGVLVDGQAPQALQESLGAYDILGSPRARRIQRTHGHLINAQGIGTEVAANIVRSNGILQGLTHLAVLLIDLFAVVVELAVLFLYFSGRHVHAAGIRVGIGLDIALVVQAAVGLLGANKAQVKEHLVPEAGVEQMQHRVLDAANVEVHAARVLRAMLLRTRAGPVALVLDIAECLIIAGIDIAQLVPGRTRPLRHNVGIAEVGLWTVAQIQLDLDPIAHLCQWWLWLGILVLWIKGNGLIIFHLWQLYRQHGFRQGVGKAVLVIDDGEGLAPVTLAGEEPIAQLVLHLFPAGAVLFQPFDGRGNGLGLVQAVEIQALVVGGINQRAVLGPGFFLHVSARNNLRNG